MFLDSGRGVSIWHWIVNRLINGPPPIRPSLRQWKSDLIRGEVSLEREGELVFYCSNVSEIWPHKRGVFGKSGFIRGNLKNQYNPTLWYRKFYDIVFSCAISTNFRCHFLKLTTTVPLDTDTFFFFLIKLFIKIPHWSHANCFTVQ